MTPTKKRLQQIQIVTKGLWNDETRECILKRARCNSNLITEVMRADKKLNKFCRKRHERVRARQEEILKECLRRKMNWKEARARAGCRGSVLSNVLRENPELRREKSVVVPIPTEKRKAIDRMALDNKDFVDIVKAVQLSCGAVRRYIGKEPNLQDYYGTLSKHITMKERTVIEKLLKRKKSYPYIATKIGFDVSTVSQEVRTGRLNGKYSAKYGQNLANKRQLQKARNIQKAKLENNKRRREAEAEHDLYTSDGEKFTLEY